LEWLELNQCGGTVAPDDGLRLRNSVLRDVKLRGLRVAVLQVIGSTLERCDFSDVVVTGGGLMSPMKRVVTYRDCDFSGADLRRVLPGAARFEHCRFADTRLDGWVCLHTEFIECVFSGRLIDVTFWGSISNERHQQELGRQHNEFHDNDFENATLRLVGFCGGIDLSKQRLPMGPQYLIVRDFPTRVAMARAAVQGWREEDREWATTLLDRYSFGAANQSDMFIDRTAMAFVPEHVRERVWALLGAQ
jgi:hypothetical protein